MKSDLDAALDKEEIAKWLSSSTNDENWLAADKAATLVRGALLPKDFLYKSWSGEAANWKGLAAGLGLREPHGTAQFAGVLICEPDARVWVVTQDAKRNSRPHILPKGRVETDADLKATALQAAWVQAGLKVKLLSWLGDYAWRSLTCRMYLAAREEGSPTDMGRQTLAVSLVPMEQLRGWLGDEDQAAISAWAAWQRPFTDVVTSYLARLEYVDAKYSVIEKDKSFMIDWDDKSTSRLVVVHERLLHWHAWPINPWRIEDARYMALKLKQYGRGMGVDARARWKVIKMADESFALIAWHIVPWDRRVGILRSQDLWFDAFVSAWGKAKEQAERIGFNSGILARI